jgi:hypothetical protein
MTATSNVDLVLVIDTSASMRPCIDGLRAHLRELLKPMQGYVANVRFGLVGLSASMSNGQVLYVPATLAGGLDSIERLYATPNQYKFFTEDPDEVIKRLEELTISGDEDNLVALDLAMDHPFGPSDTHKRVIALFSDEKLEAGVQRSGLLGTIPQVVEKLHARRIKLFCAMPYSDAAQQLAEANGSEIEDIGDAAGLASVDFKMLLTQMGKSISVSSLQGSSMEEFTPALYGQNTWAPSSDSWKEADD